MLAVSAERTSRLSESLTERRSTGRFPIVRELVYKTLPATTSSVPAYGTTINISSNGVLFATQNPPLPGNRLELSISWPVQLDGKCGLQLVAHGRVVWTDASSAAVEIQNYEFRTRASRRYDIRRTA